MLFARVLNLLGPRFGRVVYLARESQERGPSLDCALDGERVEVWLGPNFAHFIDVLRRALPMLRSYRRLIDAADVVFLGGMEPLGWYIHLCCARRRKRLVQWLVGNRVGVLRMESRFGGIKDKLALAYAMMDDALHGATVRVSQAKLVVNGQELGAKWGSLRPRVVVSTTISRREFRERTDTCVGEKVRLLFVGFIRPEKGLEYLLRALAQVESSRRVVLSIAGSRERYPAKRGRLDGVIEGLGLADRICWEGYASFGPELFGHLGCGGHSGPADA